MQALVHRIALECPLEQNEQACGTHSLVWSLLHPCTGKLGVWVDDKY